MTELLNALAEPGGIIRHVSAVLCLAAFAGLLWRLVGRLGIDRTVMSLVLTLFAALELIVALGTARRAALGGPVNEAQWFVIFHAVAVIALMLAWDRFPTVTPTERRHP